jgi:copper transporter 1
MSNFLYGFHDHLNFNQAHGPSRPVPRDSLNLHDPPHPALHPIHHHPHHHPHLTLRPSTTPAPRLLPLSTTMSPLLERPSHQHQQVVSSPYASDHSSAQQSSMKSYLHSDFGDTVLFKSWVLHSTWDIVLTCLAFLLLAILYEGIKCYREHLFKRLSFAVKKQVPVLGTLHHHHIHQNGSGVTHSARQRQESPPDAPSFSFGNSNFNLRILSLPHTIQTVLHVVQMLLSYTLMLAFMTFNLYICMSIILGAGIGYFMFYWRKITVVHVTDCH